MKKILYSALAIATAIGGVAATKANAHRANTFFRLIVANPASVHDVTLTTNWTFTANNAACASTNRVCQIATSTAAQSYTGGRLIPTLLSGDKINAAASTLPGAYKLTTPSGTTIVAATNKVN